MALALALQSRVCSPRLQRHLGPNEVPMNLMALLLGPEEKLGTRSSWALWCGSSSRAQAPGFPVSSAKEPGHDSASAFLFPAPLSLSCCPQARRRTG